MSVNKDLKTVGVIANTFGKKGTVKLLVDNGLLFNSESSWVDKLFFYQDEQAIMQPLKISNLVQTQHNLLLVDFVNITNLDVAEKLKHKVIYGLMSDKMFSEKINYAQFVVLWNDQQYPVIEVLENAKYPLVKVMLNQKGVWIPLVDEYVSQIDEDNKVLVARNLERLS